MKTEPNINELALEILINKQEIDGRVDGLLKFLIEQDEALRLKIKHLEQDIEMFKDLLDYERRKADYLNK